MSTRRDKLRSRLVPLVAAIGLLAALLPAQVWATAATDASATAAYDAAGNGGQPHDLTEGGIELTLITGDVVRYGGSAAELLVTAMAPGTRSVQIYEDVTGVYALPDQAVPLVSQGVVDRMLFNVSHLAENGYADPVTPRLPLIVSYATEPVAAAVNPGSPPPDAQQLRQRAVRLPATARAVGLPSVHGAGVEVRKDRAYSFWESLTAPGGTEVTKVWLDRRVTVTLDDSRDQIGAPQAWDLGYDGSGVTIAVLDTGYDPAHPDLADRVVDARSFVPGETVHDGHGHGTHVAATAAGTGAASDGRYAGVAPAADLLIGKVLSDSGSGYQSEIIAGMEWAVEQGADIVNMSLGACCSDGTDPMSMAVNRLTAETGTLFTVAAGNNGPEPLTVATPGSATAALTVAAVDRNDNVAQFSSRGPVVGSFSLKPDIAAPGVGIVAARSDDTSMGTPVGDHHTRASGTSMAAPHVAGAAALLAQRYPDWRAPQLKAALMSSTAPLADSPYDVGAGRLDAYAAVSATVFATTGSVDFGVHPWPHDGAPEHLPVEYLNTGESDVTLTLDLQASGPSGLFTIDTDTVTVPAGGTAEVTITLHESISSIGGAFGGVLVANGDNGASARTAVGARLGDELHPVELEILQPERGLSSNCTSVSIFDHQTLTYSVDNLFGDCNPTITLPTGRYAITVNPGAWWDEVDGRRHSYEVVRPEVAVTGPTSLRFDARNPQPVSVDLPLPHEDISWSYGTSFHTAAGEWQVRWTMTNGMRTAVVGVDGSDAQDFNWNARGSTIQPMLQMSVVGRPSVSFQPTYVNLLSLTNATAGAQRQRLDGTDVLPLVDVGTATEAEIDRTEVAGAVALVRFGELASESTETLPATVGRLTDAGAAAVLAYTTGVVAPLDLSAHGSPDHVPAAYTSQEVADRLLRLLAAGPVELRYEGTPEPSYQYVLDLHQKGEIPSSGKWRIGRHQLVEIDSRYHADHPVPVTKRVATWRPAGAGSFGVSTVLTFDAPGNRIDYYGPVDPDAVWDWHLSPAPGFNSGSDTYPRHLAVYDRAGRYGVEQWRMPGLVPGNPRMAELVEHPANVVWEPPLCTACRQGDLLSLTFQMTDGRPNVMQYNQDWMVLTGLTPGQQLRVTVDGDEVPVTPRIQPFYFWRLGATMPVPSVVLPDRASEVEIHQRLDMPWADRAFARSTETTWRYTSRPAGNDQGSGYYACLPGEPGCHPEPLILLGYDLSELGLDNTAEAGEPFSFRVLPYYQQGVHAQVTKVDVQVSFDDGDTWYDAAAVAGTDGHWDVTVTHPDLTDTSGAVSIRTTAQDAGGSSVQQTLHRAYGLSDDPLRPEKPVLPGPPAHTPGPPPGRGPSGGNQPV